MELVYAKQDGVYIVLIGKEILDAKDAPEFKQKVLDLIAKEDCRKAVIDLSKLKFIDSSGLGSILGISRSLQHRGGSLKLACMSAARLSLAFAVPAVCSLLVVSSSLHQLLSSFLSTIR